MQAGIDDSMETEDSSVANAKHSQSSNDASETPSKKQRKRLSKEAAFFERNDICK